MFDAIFISAGHGIGVWNSKDPGAVARRGIGIVTERSINVAVGNKVVALAKAKGLNVVEVGINTEAKASKKVTYANDVLKKNKYKDALFISLHCNASNGAGTGVCGYYTKNMNKVSVNSINAEIDTIHEYFPSLQRRQALSTSKSRFKKLYIDDVKCPAIMIEMGFIDNRQDQDILINQQDRLAEAIVHSLLSL